MSILLFKLHNTTFMPNRPDEALKQVANELASLLCSNSNNTVQMENLLKQLCNQAAVNNPVTAEQQPAAGAEEWIGIWKRTSRDGELFYEKDPSLKKEWSVWADVNRL